MNGSESSTVHGRRGWRGREGHLAYGGAYQRCGIRVLLGRGASSLLLALPLGRCVGQWCVVCDVVVMSMCVSVWSRTGKGSGVVFFVVFFLVTVVISLWLVLKVGIKIIMVISRLRGLSGMRVTVLIQRSLLGGFLCSSFLLLAVTSYETTGICCSHDAVGGLPCGWGTADVRGILRHTGLLVGRGAVHTARIVSRLSDRKCGRARMVRCVMSRRGWTRGGQ